MPGNGGIHISNIFPAWADMSGSNLANPRYALRTAPCQSFHPSKRIAQVQVSLSQISVRFQYLLLSPYVCLIWKKWSGESPKHPQLGHPLLSPGTGTVGCPLLEMWLGDQEKRMQGVWADLVKFQNCLCIFSACYWSSTGSQKLSAPLPFTRCAILPPSPGFLAILL